MQALKAHDPSHIGAYVLLARLGAGGMGQVYLARSPGGRLVAIKVIRDEITGHPEALARFRREAETVRAVRSAYTANLIDASLETPPYWLATEYVAGPTLSKAVAERGPFPPDSARRLLAALAEALASVHGYGVTHRDLKPQNVILSPQGPLLIDFGIARGTADTALTQTGLTPGTPGYSAPEVVIRNEVSAAADVFALGATLANAATGRPPFGAGLPHAVAYRAVHESVDVVGVEPELAALIEACVAKEPDRRPGLEEVITRCAVSSALTEDPFYGSLTSTVDAAPRDLPAAVAAGLVPPGHGAAPTGYVPTAVPGQLPTAGSGYVPTVADAASAGAPGRPRSRRTPWIVALSLAVVVGTGTAVALRTLGQGSDNKGGAASATVPSASATPQKPPGFILDNGISNNFWRHSDDPNDETYGRGNCPLIGGGSPPMDLQYEAVDADVPDGADVRLRARISFRFKYADLREKKPDPYYVSVGVKPPHDIDYGAGKPYDTMSPNKRIGYTSKPVDIFTHWKDGGYVDLVYPDDFQAHESKGKAYDAIPIADDPGDWTVVFYHVKGSPTDYESIGCTGFRRGNS